MQTLSSLTPQSNIRIPKDLVYQIIHRRFLKFTPAPRFTAKLGGAFDFFFEEIANI